MKGEWVTLWIKNAQVDLQRVDTGGILYRVENRVMGCTSPDTKLTPDYLELVVDQYRRWYEQP